MQPYQVQGNIPFPWAWSTEGAQLTFQEEIESPTQLFKYYPIIGLNLTEGVNTGRYDAKIVADTENLETRALIKRVMYGHDGEITDTVIATLELTGDGHTVAVTVNRPPTNSATWVLMGIGTYREYNDFSMHLNKTDGTLQNIEFPYVPQDEDLLTIVGPTDTIGDCVMVLGLHEGGIMFNMPLQDDTYFSIDEVLSDEGNATIIYDSNTRVTILGIVPSGFIPLEPTYIRSDGVIISDGDDGDVIWTFGGRPIKPAATSAGIENSFDVDFTPSPISDDWGIPVRTWVKPSQMPIKLAVTDFDLNPTENIFSIELPVFFLDELEFYMPTNNNEMTGNVEANRKLQCRASTGCVSPLEFRIE